MIPIVVKVLLVFEWLFLVANVLPYMALFLVYVDLTS